MAWTTMHFAVGMGCAGLGALCACTILKRGWRWLPATMTLGGVWALLPDMPRIFREDLPIIHEAIIPLSRGLETRLHEWGNLFFFHSVLDNQPRELALLGLTLILIFYNAAILLLMTLESRQRHSILYRAHHNHVRARLLGRRNAQPPPPSSPQRDGPDDEPSPVIGRIRSSHFTRTG